MKRRSGTSLNLQTKRLKEDESSTSRSSSATPLGSALPTPATSDSEAPTQKRGRPEKREAIEQVVTSSYNDSTSEAPTSKRRRRKVQRELSHIAIDGPAFPRSAYEYWKPPAKKLQEVEAISLLSEAHQELYTNMQLPDYVYFQLDEFRVYRPQSAIRHELELVTLDRLSQDRFPEFLFDGVLSVGEERCYVEAVPFRILTIDGYGEPESTDLGSQMSIQSPIARRKHVWYKFGKPAVDYRRFYNPFLWVARFTKHFIDYLLETEKVTLHHFRKDFYQWLRARYQGQTFQSWLAEAGLTDFGTTVAANFGFLYKECYSIDFDLCEHPVWDEVDPCRLKTIPQQPNLEQRTVVTPYAYECFKSMYFGDQLQKRQIAESELFGVNQRKERLRLTPNHQELLVEVLTPLSIERDSPDPITDIATGNVVRVRPDEETRWRSKTDVWYAYVQQVRIVGANTLLDVLWLYQPGHTTLGKSSYPFPNELFMSDHCECGKDALDLECVVDKVPVSWFARDPYAETGFFVRQKYRTVAELDTYDFVTLQQSDFTCQCDHHLPIYEDCRSKYTPGDTVLVRDYDKHIGEDRLQPAQIVRFDDVKTRIHLRVLSRRSEVDPRPRRSGTRPNELVLTDERIDSPPSAIIRKCHVRFFTEQQVEAGDIVTPYDRNGTGDFWFIAGDDRRIELTDTVDSMNGLEEAKSELGPPLTQGWDPANESPKKLNGMGIFCGGGIFDRGLEEGGAVKFRYAVDWAEQALHSYRANTERPEDVQYFLGSVDDYLAKAMAGFHKDCIARIGDVNVISAGSPCPGFSTLQSDRNSHQSRRNASMVASVVSFVDLYVPEYLILENVVNMTNSTAGPKKDENVFSQILAALVGLGYQVQQFLMDAWSYASSQSRSRVFIIASAPGLPPLPQPNHSHSHPPGTKERSLGNTDNKLPFGRRRTETTPFQFVPAEEAVADLPYIGDSQPQLCPRFPDHRTGTHETNENRWRMASVPTRPSGLGLIHAKHLGVLRGEPLEYVSRVNAIRSSKNSKMYARIHPGRLLPTIITKLVPQDGIAGQFCHWDQHRVITVMEAKRAQGFLDHEVLIGTHVHQMKIVGNSVDRKVALVLGLGLRESWMGEHGVVLQEPAAADDVVGGGEREELDINETSGDAVGNTVEPVGYDENNAATDSPSVHEEEGYQTAQEDLQVAPTNDNCTIDNRSAKIALLDLSEDDSGEIRLDGFKAINRIFARKAAEGLWQPGNEESSHKRAGSSQQ